MVAARTEDSGEAIQVRIDVLAATVAARLERIIDTIAPEPEPRPPISNWREYAACAFTFNAGVKGEEPITEHYAAVRQLKSWCETCPVCQECGDFATATGQVAGVWGGVSRYPQKYGV